MKLKGYIFSRPFLSERVPQHIQNIVLNDYCKKTKNTYLLSGAEYASPGSTYILNSILKSIRNIDGILFYSLNQLPEKFSERAYLYKKILKNNKQLHFAVENRVCKSQKDFNDLDEIFNLKLKLESKEKFVFGKECFFVQKNHSKIKRDYFKRLNNNKINCMKKARKYDFNFWDGNRKYGYGGYKYITGYHRETAKSIIKRYKLKNDSSLLDLGCGKGFLLYEIKQILPGIKILGLDVSRYAVKNAKKECKKFIKFFDLNKPLKFKENEFDLVISINTLHNLNLDRISSVLRHMSIIAKKQYLCVESYRNEEEQFNVQAWALTADTIISLNSWKWIFKNSRYSGDYEFIYF